jgi:hypothetical protein
MSKTAEIELQQLKTALSYLAGLLDEGSLLAEYDAGMRQAMAHVLDLLLTKVANLPAGTPEYLVQATAVQALASATEQFDEAEPEDRQLRRQHRMREAEVAAAIQGHQLGEWQQISQSDSDMEFGAKCKFCEGFVYVNYDTTYNLLSEACSRL